MAEDGAGALTTTAALADRGSPPPPVAASGAIAHAFRPTIFKPEHRFVLDGDVLSWNDGDKEARTSLADIVRIRIFAVPSGLGPPVRTLSLTLRSGRKVTLQANSYVRFGVIENRDETYRHLVEALVQRVAAINSQVEVLVGPPTAIWAFWLSTLIAALLMLIFGAMLVVSGDVPLPAVTAFAVILLFLPRVWRGVVGNRARRVDPAQLPPRLFSTEQ